MNGLFVTVISSICRLARAYIALVNAPLSEQEEVEIRTW